MKFLKLLRLSSVFSVLFSYYLITFSSTIHGQGLFDPLSQNEQAFIANLSNAVVSEVVQDIAGLARTPSRNPLAGYGRVVLLSERRAAEKGRTAQRLADVYIYDYDLDELIHLIIDARSQDIVQRITLTETQLPLIEEEINRAMEIVFQDDEYRDLLDAEFIRITGRTLENISDLDFKAFVFHADTLLESANISTRECGLHRCAQLLLYSADNIVLDISPIVDLSLGIVTQYTGASISGHQHSHTGQ